MDEDKRTFSISLPIPDWVTERPPNICAASCAVARPVLVTYLEQAPESSRQVVDTSKERRLLFEKSYRTSDLIRLFRIGHLRMGQVSGLEDSRQK